MGGLGQELAGVAVEQALDGAVDAVPLVAVGAVGEQAHRQHPPGAVDAVDRDGPAGVVDVGHVVEEPHPEADQQPGDDSDHAGRPGGDEGAGGGDRHQPGQHPVAGHGDVGLPPGGIGVGHGDDEPEAGRQQRVDRHH